MFALYVAGYSAFRIFEDTIRIDYSNYVLGMRLNFWIATLLCLAGLTWFVAIQRGWGLRRKRRSVPGADSPSSEGAEALVTQRRA